MSDSEHKSLMSDAEHIDIDAVMAEYDGNQIPGIIRACQETIVRYFLAVFSLFLFYMNLISVWPRGRSGELLS